MDLNVQGIAWLGVRTERHREMREFFAHVLGIPEQRHEEGVSVFRLPNGDTIEVFPADDPDHDDFTTGPVAGFLVSDIEVARAELERAGIELLGPVGRGGGLAWAHFRGPDGNVYELTEDANRDPGGFMADLPG